MELHNYTKCGECSNCGECCSDFLHLSEKEITRIDIFLKKHKVMQHNKGSNNSKCPFRNEELKKCDIYEVRPDICKIFKCDIPPEQAFKNRDINNIRKRPRSMAELFFKDDSKMKLLEQIGIKLYRRGEK